MDHIFNNALLSPSKRGENSRQLLEGILKSFYAESTFLMKRRQYRKVYDEICNKEKTFQYLNNYNLIFKLKMKCVYKIIEKQLHSRLTNKEVYDIFNDTELSKKAVDSCRKWFSIAENEISEFIAYFLDIEGKEYEKFLMENLNKYKSSKKNTSKNKLLNFSYEPFLGRREHNIGSALRVNYCDSIIRSSELATSKLIHDSDDFNYTKNNHTFNNNNSIIIEEDVLKEEKKGSFEDKDNLQNKSNNNSMIKSNMINYDESDLKEKTSEKDKEEIDINIKRINTRSSQPINTLNINGELNFENTNLLNPHHSSQLHFQPHNLLNKANHNLNLLNNTNTKNTTGNVYILSGNENQRKIAIKQKNSNYRTNQIINLGTNKEESQEKTDKKKSSNSNIETNPNNIIKKLSSGIISQQKQENLTEEDLRENNHNLFFGLIQLYKFTDKKKNFESIIVVSLELLYLRILYNLKTKEYNHAFVYIAIAEELINQILQFTNMTDCLNIICRILIVISKLYISEKNYAIAQEYLDKCLIISTEELFVFYSNDANCDKEETKLNDQSELNNSKYLNYQTNNENKNEEGGLNKIIYCNSTTDSRKITPRKWDDSKYKESKEEQFQGTSSFKSDKLSGNLMSRTNLPFTKKNDINEIKKALNLFIFNDHVFNVPLKGPVNYAEKKTFKIICIALYLKGLCNERQLYFQEGFFYYSQALFFVDNYLINKKDKESNKNFNGLAMIKEEESNNFINKNKQAKNNINGKNAFYFNLTSNKKVDSWVPIEQYLQNIRRYLLETKDLKKKIKVSLVSGKTIKSQISLKLKHTKTRKDSIINERCSFQKDSLILQKDDAKMLAVKINQNNSLINKFSILSKFYKKTKVKYIKSKMQKVNKMKKASSLKVPVDKNNYFLNPFKDPIIKPIIKYILKETEKIEEIKFYYGLTDKNKNKRFYYIYYDKLINFLLQSCNKDLIRDSGESIRLMKISDKLFREIQSRVSLELKKEYFQKFYNLRRRGAEKEKLRNFQLKLSLALGKALKNEKALKMTNRKDKKNGLFFENLSKIIGIKSKAKSKTSNLIVRKDKLLNTKKYLEGILTKTKKEVEKEFQKKKSLTKGNQNLSSSANEHLFSRSKTKLKTKKSIFDYILNEKKELEKQNKNENSETISSLKQTNSNKSINCSQNNLDIEEISETQKISKQSKSSENIENSNNFTILEKDSQNSIINENSKDYFLNKSNISNKSIKSPNSENSHKTSSNSSDSSIYGVFMNKSKVKRLKSTIKIKKADRQSFLKQITMVKSNDKVISNKTLDTLDKNFNQNLSKISDKKSKFSINNLKMTTMKVTPSFKEQRDSVTTTKLNAFGFKNSPKNNSNFRSSIKDIIENFKNKTIQKSVNKEKFEQNNLSKNNNDVNRQSITNTKIPNHQSIFKGNSKETYYKNSIQSSTTGKNIIEMKDNIVKPYQIMKDHLREKLNSTLGLFKNINEFNDNNNNEDFKPIGFIGKLLKNHSINKNISKIEKDNVNAEASLNNNLEEKQFGKNDLLKEDNKDIVFNQENMKLKSLFKKQKSSQKNKNNQLRDFEFNSNVLLKNKDSNKFELSISCNNKNNDDILTENLEKKKCLYFTDNNNPSINNNEITESIVVNFNHHKQQFSEETTKSVSSMVKNSSYFKSDNIKINNNNQIKNHLTTENSTKNIEIELKVETKPKTKKPYHYYTKSFDEPVKIMKKQNKYLLSKSYRDSYMRLEQVHQKELSFQKKLLGLRKDESLCYKERSPILSPQLKLEFNNLFVGKTNTLKLNLEKIKKESLELIRYNKLFLKQRKQINKNNSKTSKEESSLLREPVSLDFNNIVEKPFARGLNIFALKTNNENSNKNFIQNNICSKQEFTTLNKKNQVRKFEFNNMLEIKSNNNSVNLCDTRIEYISNKIKSNKDLFKITKLKKTSSIK